MYFEKGKRIDWNNVPVREYIAGDPNPKTPEEIRTYLTKTIKIDIGIEGTFTFGEIFRKELEDAVEIKKGA